MELGNKNLQVCDKSCSKLSKTEIDTYLKQLNSWSLCSNENVQRIKKTYTTSNFLSALEQAKTIAALAEKENHHPELCIEWGQLTISWWTHSINGLFINDFIMAAKCDQLLNA